MLLDKNPELILDNAFRSIENGFRQKNPNITLYSDPFHKIEFISRLIDSIEIPIIFIDMDLLYTGYVESNMIQKKDNVIIFSINETNWKEKLSKIIVKTSKEKCMVIIDSLNGIYNLLDSLEFIRSINSIIMLLSSIGNQSGSPIIITAMARKKENDEWTLLPGGKHIMKTEKTGMYFIKKSMNNLAIDTLEKIGVAKKNRMS